MHMFGTTKLCSPSALPVMVTSQMQTLRRICAGGPAVIGALSTGREGALGALGGCTDKLRNARIFSEAAGRTSLTPHAGIATDSGKAKQPHGRSKLTPGLERKTKLREAMSEECLGVVYF